MIAHEKAEEIVSKYENYLYGYFTTDDEYVKCVECASIAVNEIINNFSHIKEIYEYWVKVKNEIDKL